ncbi:SusC/RagA family TonB-linked outer membrane protein [Saccharicrinis fermentans]|uniref:Outer membrane cobalamin receptor protein n=1 Tax=Saccharicrinis fermentans DSM 9555 = JCM 21142 TaxID=869213 RepID=W7YRL0_9BACT|nr:SusC/RagA family TonB-linked outer membrane protein [Saccharicrinis fermentans]GAF05064.1 outer membrane cobalamin receptor protein [Saccharicrinis fermentans DSM 9555 = JCM 21142]
MRKLALFLSLILFVGSQTLTAQTKAIAGKVVDNFGEAIPGVSIVVKGTTIGTISRPDGTYQLNVPEDAASIVFTFVGMATQEVALTGQSTINVTMESDSEDIDEVVVTAMGIKRSEKTLGYAATTVNNEELIKARNTNVSSSLSGKVAGVQVQTNSSDPGAASSVVIRGFSSINGSNQPLYVVDGIPLQSSTLNLNELDKSGQAVSTSGLSNVSADDIESMTVLKGAAATALYGSRASNGVIIITTKTGKKGKEKNFTVTYNGGLQFREVSLLPDFQNDFGQGWNGKQTYIENGSWGPALDGSTQVYGPIYNNEQLIHTYSAKNDNVKDFFEIGVSQSHSLSISGISEDEKMDYYLSYAYSNDDGIMPSDADSYKRNTIAYRTNYKATEWLKISSSVNFARSETDLVSSYQGTSVIDGLYEMPRDISIVDMEDTSSPFNQPQAYFTPYGVTNPYWSLENNYNHLDSKQIYGKLQLDINPIKDLTLTYRFGFDYSDYDLKIGTPQIAVDDELINEDYGYSPVNMNQDGNVYARYRRSYELNHDFLANYDTKFNNISFAAIGGVNINETSATALIGQTDVLTFDTGFWDLSNGSTKSTLGEAQQKKRVIGLFGDATFGYNEMLFLNLSARNDWSSTLPIDDNSYFYYGTTLSWLFTELLPRNNVLSFGKIRLAYGKTGNDADVYQTGTRYVQGYAHGYYGSNIASFPMNSSNSFIASTIAGSATLSPEMTTESEIGMNLQFLNGRLGLDASYYNRKTDKQIFELPVDPSTGYSYNVLNFGEVENKGFELLLSTTPIRTNNFRWDVDVNFSVNKNKVLSLPESVEGGKVQIYRFAAGDDAVYMYAEEGKPMGQYYTYLPQYVTDDESEFFGSPIVDSHGQPVLGEDVEDTGRDMNHDWTGGVNTTLSAYGFSLSAALDVRYGGTMFSRTKNLMQFTGNGIATTYNNRNPFIIPNSVQATDNGDGTMSYSENTEVLKLSDSSIQDYYNKFGYGNGARPI